MNIKRIIGIASAIAIISMSASSVFAARMTVESSGSESFAAETENVDEIQLFNTDPIITQQPTTVIEDGLCFSFEVVPGSRPIVELNYVLSSPQKKSKLVIPFENLPNVSGEASFKCAILTHGVTDSSVLGCDLDYVLGD